MTQLNLSNKLKTKLLELCIHYFPETEMKIVKFSDGYKGHQVKFKNEIEENWPRSCKSPRILMGFHQFQNNDGAIDYQDSIEIHWYELCMCELAIRMYQDNYQKKMTKLFYSNKNVINFLYDDYLEDFDLNITNYN